MAENIRDEKYENATKPELEAGEPIAVGIDDTGAIPKGSLDPVYEAKARVLNRAVWKVKASRHGRRG
jgi:hypothetical protein